VAIGTSIRSIKRSSGKSVRRKRERGISSSEKRIGSGDQKRGKKKRGEKRGTLR